MWLNQQNVKKHRVEQESGSLKYHFTKDSVCAQENVACRALFPFIIKCNREEMTHLFLAGSKGLRETVNVLL